MEASLNVSVEDTLSTYSGLYNITVKILDFYWSFTHQSIAHVLAEMYEKLMRD